MQLLQFRSLEEGSHGVEIQMLRRQRSCCSVDADCWSWEEGPCAAETQTSEVGALTGAGVWSRQRWHEAGSAHIRKPTNRTKWLLPKELLPSGVTNPFSLLSPPGSWSPSSVRYCQSLQAQAGKACKSSISHANPQGGFGGKGQELNN